MKILFDQCTPVPLRNHLPSHLVATAFEQGWSTLDNGDLLRAAEADGFDVLVTTDANLKSQQRLRGRRLAIVVLLSTSWPKIAARVEEVRAAVESATPGVLVEVPIG